MKSVLFVVFLFCAHSASAKVFGVNGGALIQSKTVYRGALIWNKPSFFVGPSFVFYEKLFVRGPNLSYQFFDRKSSYRLNMGIALFNDMKPIFSFSDDDETIRNSRDSALDFNVQAAYKFGYRKAFEIGATLSQDFIEHKALYFEPQFSFPVAPFTKIRLFAGSGGQKLNSFLYGFVSNSIISHYGVSLSLFLPPFLVSKVLPKGGILLSLDQTYIAGAENRLGPLHDGAPDNLNFSLRYFCKLY